MSQPYNQPKPGGYNPYTSPTPGVGPPFFSGQGEPHRGTMILVFGILGLVMCPILGVIAWVLGKADIAKMDAGRMDPSGRGNTQAGMICGIIATVLLVLQLGAVCCYFGMIFTAIGAAGVGNAGGL